MGDFFSQSRLIGAALALQLAGWLTVDILHFSEWLEIYERLPWSW